MSRGFVYLIGAGPGDQGLMTVKGLEALKKSDVVIYDHLAGVSLLTQAPLEAELIYAGKQAGKHYMKQEETTALMIKKAAQGKVVARLKGGDPFIFGRGGEEALALKDAGIDYEVIPGVSSSYAAAAYAGIPVTHRAMASSFHVITGHEDASKEASSLDYEVLAKEEGTLVFMMGLKNLPQITQKLIRHGKDGKTPAAVIERGTLAGQKCVTGTLETIAEDVSAAGIKTPAVTVIGQVASLHKKLDWLGQGPLAGRRVLVTASRELSGQLCEDIRSLGGEPADVSLIYTVPIHGNVLKQWMAKPEAYTWIVLTSRNGVDIFFEHMKNAGIDIRRLSHLKFAVIGSGTKKALEARGIFADCLPEKYSSRHLGEVLVPMLNKNDSVLLLRAKEASDVLPQMLEQAGVNYRCLPIYKTVTDGRRAEELNRMAQSSDYVTFCSASAVHAFCENLEPQTHVGGKIVCIGPVTAAAAARAGFKEILTAEVYTTKGLAKCMAKDAGGESLS